jgi:hypothetical protein
VNSHSIATRFARKPAASSDTCRVRRLARSPRRCDHPGIARLIPIGTFANRSEAELVLGLLASAGIPASILADDAGGAYPFELSGGAQVLVDEDNAEAASEVLASRTNES